MATAPAKVRFAKSDGDDVHAAIEFNVAIRCEQFASCASDDRFSETLIFAVMDQIEACLSEDGEDSIVERLKSATRRKLAGGDLSGFGSRKHTKEAKARLSAATKAAWARPETRERLLAATRAGIARWKARQQHRKGDAQKPLNVPEILSTTTPEETSQQSNRNRNDVRRPTPQ